ncbi:MAG: ABC transporter ATP-binding protein, partial [Candidatus Nanohaloarchaea archaeon]
VALPMLLAGEASSTSVTRAEEALEQVGLGDRLNHRPSELSGGERQRVAIARAIVNEPAVVLADEPTSELDTATSRDIMDVFRSLSETGHTVVTVNHEEQIGDLADRVIWLEDGAVAER